MIRHKITPEQYTRLLDAKNNWPDHLNSLENYYENPGCMLIYLAKNAEIKVNDRLSYIEPSPGRQEISQFYGIPDSTLIKWAAINDFFYLSGKRRRAKGMLRRFQKFLNKVEIAPDPSETTEVEKNEIRNYQGLEKITQ